MGMLYKHDRIGKYEIYKLRRGMLFRIIPFLYFVFWILLIFLIKTKRITYSTFITLFFIFILLVGIDGIPILLLKLSTGFEGKKLIMSGNIFRGDQEFRFER